MNKQTLLLLTLLVIGGLFRFVNLNWGAPFYFHPDERNIASAISQLQIPNQLNPHFFAYGSLPIYLFFFTGLIGNFFSVCHGSISSCSVSFEQAILVSRMFSAVFSVLLIPLLFKIGEKLYGETGGLFAAALATFSVGLIQFAHFGTYETLITYFATLLFYLILLYIEKPERRMFVVFLGVTLGILIALKISDLALVPLPLLAVLFVHIKQHTFSPKTVRRILQDCLSILCLSAIIFLLANPYILLDFTAFQGSMTYETSVATGTLPVFYTQEFLHSTPFLYHVIRIYPFLLNPLLTVLFLPAVCLLMVRLRKPKVAEVFLWLFFLSLFIPQIVLYVKWTRYLVPTLPFIYLLFTAAGTSLFIMKKRYQPVLVGGSLLILLLASVYAFSYVRTVFLSPDTRIAAAVFATEHLPQNARLLSEVYDLGITPFNPVFPTITLFNFYDLETTSPEANPEALRALQRDTDYVILPSPRVLKTRLTYPQTYPRGYAFYSALQAKRGYTKVYETPCDVFCRITYLGDPIFRYEDTANVFDRPTVMIYKKI